MHDFAVAVSLILVIEGVLYALFPDGMKKLMLQVIGMPVSTLRNFGLGLAMIGVVLVWLIRG